MKRDIRLYLEDIRESISAIEEYTQNVSKEKFYKDRQNVIKTRLDELKRTVI